VVEGFAHEGDLDSAEAVYASNRRAGVDACKSWCAIVAALFEASDDERAFALLAQVRACTSGGRHSSPAPQPGTLLRRVQPLPNLV
jgi:hypothetical protein